MNKCKIKHCSELSACKGYCGKHYQRLKKYGNAESYGKFIRIAGTPIHRIMKRVKFNKDTGCWEHQGYKNSKGYSRMCLGYANNVLVHRYMYEFYNEVKIPKGMCICHSCDNPACVNPAHLWMGTDYDNAQDRVKKGRSGFLYGENNHASIVSDVERLQIKKEINAGISNVDLAKIHNLTMVQIRGIRKRIVRNEYYLL